MEKRIEPQVEIDLDSFMEVDMEKAKMQMHENFDRLMQARDELFESRLKKGLAHHERFLDSVRKI